VLTGSYGNNFGEKFEPKGEMMKPGSLFVLNHSRSKHNQHESGRQGLARSWETAFPSN
jgi:hypothetical protein